jgi:ribosome-binding protein aMBF1 (putative translation factor)
MSLQEHRLVRGFKNAPFRCEWCGRKKKHCYWVETAWRPMAYCRSCAEDAVKAMDGTPRKQPPKRPMVKANALWGMLVALDERVG